MRKFPSVLLGVALLLAAVAMPTAAASPIIDVSHDKGGSAYADHFACAPDTPHHGDETCEFASVWVFQGWSNFNGDRFRGERACVSVGTSVYDSSAETYTDSFSFGCSDSADVWIAKDLGSATAEATVATESQTCVYDVQSDTYTCSDPVSSGDLVLDLVWTGIPPVYKSSYHSRDQFGDCTYTSFFKGQFADATVDGSIDSVAAFDFAQIQSGNGRFTYSCHT